MIFSSPLSLSLYVYIMYIYIYIYVYVYIYICISWDFHHPAWLFLNGHLRTSSGAVPVVTPGSLIFTADSCSAAGQWLQARGRNVELCCPSFWTPKAIWQRVIIGWVDLHFKKSSPKATHEIPIGEGQSALQTLTSHWICRSSKLVCVSMVREWT